MEENEMLTEENPSGKNPWYPDPYAQTIELADGETLSGHAALNTTEDDLWVWVDEAISMGKACLIFEDPIKTKIITSHTTETETLIFKGYTRLNTVRTDATGKVSIRMKKGE